MRIHRLHGCISLKGVHHTAGEPHTICKFCHSDMMHPALSGRNIIMNIDHHLKECHIYKRAQWSGSLSHVQLFTKRETKQEITQMYVNDKSSNPSSPVIFLLIRPRILFYRLFANHSRTHEHIRSRRENVRGAGQTTRLAARGSGAIYDQDCEGNCQTAIISIKFAFTSSQE